jgi:hypothetical protein
VNHQENAMTTLITADHYAATTQAVEVAIDAAKAGETVIIECLRASTRLAIEAELADEADDISGDVYSGEAWDDAEDATDDDMVRWTVRLA